MQINRCPKCGRKPRIEVVKNCGKRIIVSCCDRTRIFHNCSRAEVIVKWNAITKGGYDDN